MFISALLTTVKKQNQTKCSPINEWIQKIYVFVCVCMCAHTYNGILVKHKKNEILLFVATWMELKNIMLSKVSQIPLVLTHLWKLKSWFQRSREYNNAYYSLEKIWERERWKKEWLMDRRVQLDRGENF